MELRTLVRIDKSARRLAEIIGLFAKYGLADWISNVDYPWLKSLLKSSEGEEISEFNTAERLRSVLMELGPAFIKLGQILSTRPDLVGPEVMEELGKLRTRTKPDPTEIVLKTIEEELGSPVGDLFETFEETPLASASIGQVHAATLPGGRRVVVKVMRSEIEESVRRDLDLFVGLAELAEKHAPQLRRFQPLATARYFQRTLLRELDFAYERRHLERFTSNFADDETVRFPEAFPERSSTRVLTMERLDGIPINDREALKASGIDLTEIARRGGAFYLEMIFRDGFYHADPHPGNLLVLDNEVIGVLDCGMVGYIDESLREDIESILLSVVDGDAETLTDIVVDVGQVPPELDRDELRAELSEFLSDYVGQSLDEFDLSGALQRIFGIFRDFGIILPPSFGMLVKTIVVLEGTSRQVTPNFSLASLLRPYYIKSSSRRLAPKRVFAEFRRTYRDWKRLADTLPRDLVDILNRFRKGTLEVHMEHRRLESTVDRLVTGLIVAALFLGSSMMWSMSAPPLAFGVSVFGALGFAASVFMGARLLYSIRKANRKKRKPPGT